VNLRQSSKEELLSFIDTKIHPSSSHRSVVSVHVKSQIKSHPRTSTDQLVSEIRFFITREGYDIPPSEVSEAANGDYDQITQNLHSLMLKHGYDNTRVEESLAKWTEMNNSPSTTKSTGTFNILNEVKVIDIDNFRKTLKMDQKPAPVQLLQTFYRCE
jgi:hypothetical protein